MNTSQAAGSAGLAAVCALLNGGTLVMYSGTQPATAETALSGNTALVTWTFSATAFGAPSFGSGKETGTASFVAASMAPSASGTATFARSYKSDGTTVVADLTVGTSGADINLGSTTISTGVNVNLTSVTLSIPVA